MAQVTVQAQRRVLGLREGQTERVEATELIRAHIRSEHLRLIAEHPDPVAVPVAVEAATPAGPARKRAARRPKHA